MTSKEPQYDNFVDLEANYPNYNLGFDNRAVRIGFRNKVLGVVCVQLLITIGVCTLFMQDQRMNDLMNGPHKNALYILATISMFVSMCIIICNKKYRYQVPHNYGMLLLFTLSTAYTIGLVCTQYKTNLVILAAGATLTVSTGLIIYAITTKRDFTMMGGALGSALLILMFMGIIQFFLNDSVYNFVYSGLGAFIFSLYLIYDVQLISSGNHKNELSPDDYIYGALSIYLDIINLFLYILQLFNSKD